MFETKEIIIERDNPISSTSSVEEMTTNVYNHNMDGFSKYFS